MHNLSSRKGSGSKISVLEIVAPRALTAGEEYYINSEGSIISEAEMLPVVMLPRENSAITAPNLNVTQAAKANYHQVGSTQAWGSAATVGPHLRVPLTTAPYVMYLQIYSPAQPRMFAVVMNEVTGERVAEHDFNAYTNSSTYFDPSNLAIAWALTGTDKVGLLCNHTTNTGSNYNLRVVEFTFNAGTMAVTSAAKTAIGSALGGLYLFNAAGFGISNAKIAVRNGASQFVVNMVDNTINAAAGFPATSNCVSEGQYVVSLGATNSVTIANLETNGSSSFTATGASWTGTPSVWVRLHPRVYLILPSSGFAANTARILTVNAGFTAGVITAIANPVSSDFVTTSVVMVQQRTDSPVFYMMSTSAQKTVAFSLVVAADGTVLSPIKSLKLAESTYQLASALNATYSGRRPFVLDVPLVCESVEQQWVTSGTNDCVAYIFVKYRADILLGLYAPKYLGRALGTYAQGANAELAASPALLQVEPTQTAFQRTGRVIKVNDLQGFFLEVQDYKFGVTNEAVSYLQASPFPIDEGGFNYPVVFGSVYPAKGKVKFSIPAYATASIKMVAISPLGVIKLTLASSTSRTVDIDFHGFLVFAARVDYNDAAQVTCSLAYDVETLDYV